MTYEADNGDYAPWPTVAKSCVLLVFCAAFATSPQPLLIVIFSIAQSSHHCTPPCFRVEIVQRQRNLVNMYEGKIRKSKFVLQHNFQESAPDSQFGDARFVTIAHKN
jgi:hypothetical protein